MSEKPIWVLWYNDDKEGGRCLAASASTANAMKRAIVRAIHLRTMTYITDASGQSITDQIKAFRSDWAMKSLSEINANLNQGFVEVLKSGELIITKQKGR